MRNEFHIIHRELSEVWRKKTDASIIAPELPLHLIFQTLDNSDRTKPQDRKTLTSVLLWVSNLFHPISTLRSANFIFLLYHLSYLDVNKPPRSGFVLSI